MKPDFLRICLLPDGSFLGHPWYGGEDGDYKSPLPSEEVVHLITAGQVSFEVAACDPDEEKYEQYVRNYESLALIKLARI